MRVIQGVEVVSRDSGRVEVKEEWSSQGLVHYHIAIKIIPDDIGIEGVSVVEVNVTPQNKGPGTTIRSDSPRLREKWDCCLVVRRIFVQRELCILDYLLAICQGDCGIQTVWCGRLVNDELRWEGSGTR